MWKTIEIVFTAHLGESEKVVKLSQIFGMGDNTHFDLQLGKTHQGMLFKVRGEWYGPSCLKWDDIKIDLTSDDIQSMAERIEEAFKLERIDLTLTGVYGDDTRKISIFEVRPAVFEVRIYKDGDYKYIGRVMQTNGHEWTGECGYGTWEYISTDDIYIISEIINSHRNNIQPEC